MLYVVELVARMHHAVVYEMKTAAAPEKAIAKSKKPRPSAGLLSQYRRLVHGRTNSLAGSLSSSPRAGARR